MPFDRRSFLRHAAALGGSAFLGPSLAPLASWSRLDATTAAALKGGRTGGYGELVQSPDCPELWIPTGFRVKALSRTQSASIADPEFRVPNAMDGMAAFPLDGERGARSRRVRLIRNHEMTNAAARAVPLGPRPYDPMASGGTTSLEVEISGDGPDLDVRLTAEYVSLGGTHVNCAGGPTPWGSWLSCEETTSGPEFGFEQPHGYIFEVPASATSAVEPVPLRDMGRMVHEAVAVDPRTGIVYETEDVRWEEDHPTRPGAGFYRFIPRRPGHLAEGGRLEILAVRDRPGLHTVTGQRLGERLPVRWISIEDPDPANAAHDTSAVFREGLSKGAAIFQRLEGCFWTDDSCCFVSTSGGDAGAGQVWRYVPDPADDDGGWLTLVFESPGRDVLDSPDNICLGPGGDIVICEDGGGEQFIRALRRDSTLYDLVLQPAPEPGRPGPTEFAGCCFSPDGRVLFFNVQGSTTSFGSRPGATYALWGPWHGR